jgi:hypothetical protein
MRKCRREIRRNIKWITHEELTQRLGFDIFDYKE